MVIITQSQPSASQAAPIHFHYPKEANHEVQSLGPGQIRVAFLFSPINPQDLLVIAGRYPVKPSHAHNGEDVLGYDGVARVESVGPSPSSLASVIRPGDLIIPRRHGLGTWRSRVVLDTADVIRLSPTDHLVGASLLRLVFLPAYLLIEDIRGLKPGDWLIQNVGAGTIARLVVQFARLKGVHSCSVVRDRSDEDFEQLKAALEKEGAEAVVTEQSLKENGVQAHPALSDAASRGRVVLAIDGVFGESGESLAHALSHGGTYVNYGSLGGGDGSLRLSQRLLFWSEVKFRNFRLSEQLNKRTPAEQESLFTWFLDLLARGVLQTPKVNTIRVPLEAEDTSDFEQRTIATVSTEAKKTVGNLKCVLEFAQASAAV